MSPLFPAEKPSNDLPLTTELSREDFIKYKGYWSLWRATGRRNAAGAFEPAVSFVEAARLPRAMLGTFQVLDDFYRRMESQWLEKVASKWKDK